MEEVDPEIRRMVCRAVMHIVATAERMECTPPEFVPFEGGKSCTLLTIRKSSRTPTEAQIEALERHKKDLARRRAKTQKGGVG